MPPLLCLTTVTFQVRSKIDRFIVFERYHAYVRMPSNDLRKERAAEKNTTRLRKNMANVEEGGTPRIKYTVQRDSTDAYISSGRPRREEILLRPRGDRWLFLEQRTASLGISLRDCVTRTSDANLARSLHRKKKRCADEVEETENDRERGEEKQRRKGAFLRPFSASRRNLILDWISALCRSRETLLRSSSRRFDPACRVSSQTLGTSTTLFPTSFSLLLEISSCSRSIIGIAKQEEALSTRSTLSDLPARLHVAIAIPWHTIMKIYRELA